MNDEIIKVTLDYVQKNKFNIIPLIKNDKKPPEGYSLSNAYVNRQTVESLIEWLNKPNVGNIGLMLGKTSGLAGIDIDDPAKADEYMQKYPTGMIQRTPSGGIHLFYQLPDQEHANFVRDGLEIYFRDRYFLVAPSELKNYRGHGGRVYSGKYQWIKFDKPTQFPVDLLVSENSERLSLSKYSRQEMLDMLCRVLETHKIDPGTHNDFLYYGSLLLAGDGLTLDVITSLMLGLDRRDPTPQSDFVVRSTVKRAFEAAKVKNSGVEIKDDVQDYSVDQRW